MEPIKSPKSSRTGKIDILLDFITFTAMETFEPELIVKGDAYLRSFTLVSN